MVKAAGFVKVEARAAGNLRPSSENDFDRCASQRQEEAPTPAHTETSNENAAAAEPTETPDPWMAMADNFFGGQGAGDWEREESPPEETDTPFLKPGMNATVEIAATNKRNILVLSNEAILSFGNRKMVRVIGADGQPGRPQPIEAGVSSFRQNRNHLWLGRRASRRRGRF